MIKKTGPPLADRLNYSLSEETGWRIFLCNAFNIKQIRPQLEYKLSSNLKEYENPPKLNLKNLGTIVKWMLKI